MSNSFKPEPTLEEIRQKWSELCDNPRLAAVEITRKFDEFLNPEPPTPEEIIAEHCRVNKTGPYATTLAKKLREAGYLR